MSLAYSTFSDLITFTRASGGGRFNAQGQYEWLPANTPRIDYDPVTGERRGLLIEEQRTNLLKYSSDFANAAWAKSELVVRRGDIVAPDGQASAWELQQVSINGGLYQNVPVTAGATYTFSCRVRLGTMAAGDYKIALYNNTAAAFIAADIVPTSTPTSSEWTTISHVFTVPAGCTSVRVYPYRNGTQVVGTAYIWGAQLEAGSFPSSYIPTTGAQVTRAADLASVNTLSPWYRADEGTLFVEYLAPARTSTAQYPGVIGLSATATSNRMGIYNRTDTGDYAMLVREGGVTHTDSKMPGTAFTSGAVVKAAIGYAPDGVSGCVNGGTIASDTSVVLPAVDNLRIGQMDSARINSHVKSIRFYPRRLSNTELQAMTA